MSEFRPPLNHLALVARDPVALAEFYGGILGLRTIYQRSNSDGVVESIWLQLDGLVLMIERATVEAPPPPASAYGERRPGLHLFALGLSADDRKRLSADLEAAGHRIEERSRYSLYFRDPEGNRFALTSFSADDFLKSSTDSA